MNVTKTVQILETCTFFSKVVFLNHTEIERNICCFFAKSTLKSYQGLIKTTTRFNKHCFFLVNTANIRRFPLARMSDF